MSAKQPIFMVIIGHFFVCETILRLKNLVAFLTLQKNLILYFLFYSLFHGPISFWLKIASLLSPSPMKSG